MFQQRADVERLAGEALARFGRVDILVNNASALGPTPMPSLADTPIEEFENVMRTNVTGPFMLTRALVGQMLSRGSGSIINVQLRCWGSGVSHMGRIWRIESGARPFDAGLGGGTRRDGRAHQQRGSRATWTRQ